MAARLDGATTTVTTPAGTLTLVRTGECWHGDALTVEGTSGPLHCHVHLTVRAVIRRSADLTLRQGSELWVHVELAPAAHAGRVAAIVRHTVGRAPAPRAGRCGRALTAGRGGYDG